MTQQRLRPLGYTGGPTILRDYLQRARPKAKLSRAFVRMEPAPGERFEESFETFARCHMHAFVALGSVAREIAYDNLATAVAAHDGRLVRFLPRFRA